MTKPCTYATTRETPIRKNWVAWLILTSVSLMLSPPAATAQAFPTHPVRILVGFPPGGGVDIVARALAQPLSQVWAQNVIVDNRPGANAIIATEMLARATPNGYTLQLSSPGALVITPHMGTRLSYDPLRDFAPVSVVSESAALLVTHPSVPIKTVGDLIAYARSRPGELTYASSGVGGPNHMAGELMKQLAGINLTHIPYKGSAPATADLLGGQVKLMFGVIPALLPFVSNGKLRALGLGSSNRSSALPEVPTIAESGLPGYGFSIWYGITAPQQTPRPVVSAIHSALVRVLGAPELKGVLMKGGSEPVGNTPEEFTRFIRDEHQKFGHLIKAAGLTNAQ